MNAATRVLGSDADDVHVVAGVDENGKDAYFFTYYFDDRLLWNRAVRLSTEVAIAIVDDLFRTGDEAFPFIRMLSHKSAVVQNYAATG